VQGCELFATGQHTAREVLARITAAGLLTRGNRRTPPKPVSLSQFYDILSDRYYVGKVTHDDQEYPGRHPALITEDTYDRVQQVLALRGGGGTRQRHHHHWLKGLLWCHRCGHRMVIMRGKGNGGTYFYFFCRGRQKHLCDLPYLSVTKIEAAVERHVATVRLDDDFRASVRHQLDDALLLEHRTMSELKKHLAARLDELDTREDSLLDLVDDPDWPRAKIKGKLTGIEHERAEIQAQLADVGNKLETGRQFFTAALELLADPQGFYQRGSAAVKRAMTKVIFSKLQVDAEQIAGHELAEGFRGLVEAGTFGHTARRHNLATDSNDKGGPFPEEGAAFDHVTDADLLNVVLLDHGSSKAAMVELRGIEPLTFSMRRAGSSVP
ncbi:MAG: recombinase family protein, partial [Actinobacteria bacterium]|nr:recombinase family protein [Actinomycetota bacterium]MCA1709547.1 recombinase family protein [Actinomycetota bacterium]